MMCKSTESERMPTGVWQYAWQSHPDVATREIDQP
jgi:hypothetical protein